METKLLRQTANGLAECKLRPQLERGTIVYAFGGGMCSSKWATMDDAGNLVKLSENDSDDYFSHPFKKLDKYALPIEQKFGIGFYYDIKAERATDKEIEAAITRANAFITEREEKKKKAAESWEREKREAVEKYGDFYLKAENVHDAVHVAKNIRKDLATSFKGVKFSVRKDGYSDIIVEWTDGPTKKEVKSIIGKHKTQRTADKWNQDLWDYKDTAFTAVYGGVDYLYINRHLSDEVIKPIEDDIISICPELEKSTYRNDCNDYDGFPEVMAKYGNNIGALAWLSAANIAKSYLSEVSFYKKENTPEPTIQSELSNIEIVDYSERAIAVIGDTKPIKDKLKAAGGRFNAKLTCGAGWVFPKKSIEKVRNIINGSEVAKNESAAKNSSNAADIYKKYLAEYCEEFCKDKREAVYYQKEYIGAVKFTNGWYLLFEKNKIENSFCFSDEGPEYDYYRELLDNEDKLSKYFISKNIGNMEKRLAECKQNPKAVLLTKRPYENRGQCEFCIESNYNRYDYYRGCETYKPSEDEATAIIEALEYQYMQFKKRLENYLKKYGVSKLHTWTYYVDA